MASDLSFVEFVVDLIHEDHEVTYKSMFGEYGLFSEGKMFALICDDRLLFKPTEGGLAHIGDVVLEPPYPGAKPIPLIGARMEDSQWLSELVGITVRELPLPKKRKRAKKKAK